MKHTFRLLTMVFICLVWLSSCQEGKSQGKFISSDSMAVYTLSKDSLYIDNSKSGCPLASYKLDRVDDGVFKATSLIHDPYHDGDSISNETITIREIPSYSIGWLTHYEVSIGKEYKDTIVPLNAYVHTDI